MQKIKKTKNQKNTNFQSLKKSKIQNFEGSAPECKQRGGRGRGEGEEQGRRAPACARLLAYWSAQHRWRERLRHIFEDHRLGVFWDHRLGNHRLGNHNLGDHSPASDVGPREPPTGPQVGRPQVGGTTDWWAINWGTADGGTKDLGTTDWGITWWGGPQIGEPQIGELDSFFSIWICFFNIFSYSIRFFNLDLLLKSKC